MTAQQEFMTSLDGLLSKLKFLSQAQMTAALSDFKPAEVHTLAFIGSHDGVNVTAIATARLETRSAASKMTRRLAARGLISRYKKSDNKKEVYFKLTPPGQAVFDVHAALDRKFAERDASVFAQTSPDEMATVLAFLQRYNRYLDDEISKR
ncbi:MarR family transcriptional regulator [Lacticaseibacillus pabuli]|uniref:MarR family transcriptional regulator n=1 Tax=Lacticaseibacillus pabuli TaxID=3025672 RepID=A0ABY7WSS7_9LACO|nr:MarR family transcriptional regulator [Lacticaseibacillus sp. KACC 23028]WDF83217.1 MarR family transcriptional regulator [Lacticaseibacillus sp. KACC 23028]